jgi:hypothetical protein
MFISQSTVYCSRSIGSGVEEVLASDRASKSPWLSKAVQASAVALPWLLGLPWLLSFWGGLLTIVNRQKVIARLSYRYTSRRIVLVRFWVVY